LLDPAGFAGADVTSGLWSPLVTIFASIWFSIFVRIRHVCWAARVTFLCRRTIRIGGTGPLIGVLRQSMQLVLRLISAQHTDPIVTDFWVFKGPKATLLISQRVAVGSNDIVTIFEMN